MRCIHDNVDGCPGHQHRHLWQAFVKRRWQRNHPVLGAGWHPSHDHHYDQFRHIVHCHPSLRQGRHPLFVASKALFPQSSFIINIQHINKLIFSLNLFLLCKHIIGCWKPRKRCVSSSCDGIMMFEFRYENSLLRNNLKATMPVFVANFNNSTIFKAKRALLPPICDIIDPKRATWATFALSTN